MLKIHTHLELPKYYFYSRYTIQRVKHPNRAIPSPRTRSPRYVPTHSHVRGAVGRRPPRGEDGVGAEEERPQRAPGVAVQRHGVPRCGADAHPSSEGVLPSG